LARHDRSSDGGWPRHGQDHAGHRQGQDRDWRWQDRFQEAGIAGLWRDKTRPSRIPPLARSVAERVVALTLAGPPPTASHWTGSAMAQAVGISVSSVQRIWRAHGLQPHRMRQFKLSNDPQFAAKLHDIVGLYVDPPDHAIVLSVDEKSQIQALDRTQPGLPMKQGRAGTMTHDYKRHGTTTLFAALDVLEGKVIGQCMKRHRHQEFIRFLNVIEARVPKKKAVHVIVDNYAAHKHPNVLAWLEKHPRFVFHFTRPRPPGSTPSRGSSPSSQRNVSNVACSDLFSSSKMPSTASSMRPMPSRNPLPGPRTQTKSSPPSNEGTKC
jgi:transposase